LCNVRRRLEVGGRRLDVWVTLYTHQLTPAVRPHLELCDRITLWSWRSADLKALEANLARLEALAPGKPIMLGCYMWDFGAGRPIPLEAMRRQCELGLQWLKAGRIDGMVFLGTPVCDLGLETVEWARRWIAEVGEQRLPAARRQAGEPGCSTQVVEDPS
jgi:hypothetical protein